MVGSIIKNKDFIYNNAYSSGGQSGSPIFDSNNKIIGIHIGAKNIAKTVGTTVVDSYSLHIGVKINNNIQSFINKHLNVVKNVYRLYNKGNGEHFFTCSVNEYYKLAALGWEKEGAAWMAPQSGLDVYRLYNPNNSTHFYTKKLGEKNKLVTAGYKDEGVCWKSAENDKPAVYKLYNPNSTSKQMAHHFTKSESEMNKLVNLKWKNEGIAWNAFDFIK